MYIVNNSLGLQQSFGSLQFGYLLIYFLSLNSVVAFAQNVENYAWKFLGNFPWQDFFPDISMTFSEIPDISLTSV